MDCKKHVWSNRAFIEVNEGSMYKDMGLAPAQRHNLYVGTGAHVTDSTYFTKTLHFYKIDAIFYCTKGK